VRVERQVEVGGRTVTVYELTVAEVRQWLKELAGRKGEGEKRDAADLAVDAGLYEDMQLEEIARMTDLTVEDMDAMTPSELRVVADACKEANAHFFAMRERLAALGRAMRNESS